MSESRYWQLDYSAETESPYRDADGVVVVPRGGIPYIVLDSPPDRDLSPLAVALALRATAMREALNED